MPRAAASGSSDVVSSGPNSSSISPKMWRRMRVSACPNVTETPPLRARRNCATTAIARSLVVLHRRPETVAVHRLDVALHLLAGAVTHHGLALLVHVEHQLGRPLLRVAEVLLEHERDIGHQVDRVVPDDGHPGLVGSQLLVLIGLL